MLWTGVVHLSLSYLGQRKSDNKKEGGKDGDKEGFQGLLSGEK